MLHRSITWELPYNVPFEAKKELIQIFVALWRDPSVSCFNDVFLFLEDTVDHIVSANFSQYPKLESCIRYVRLVVAGTDVDYLQNTDRQLHWRLASTRTKLVLH
jgi:hypothetical protein